MINLIKHFPCESYPAFPIPYNWINWECITSEGLDQIAYLFSLITAFSCRTRILRRFLWTIYLFSTEETLMTPIIPNRRTDWSIPIPETNFLGTTTYFLILPDRTDATLVPRSLQFGMFISTRKRKYSYIAQNCKWNMRARETFTEQPFTTTTSVKV